MEASEVPKSAKEAFEHNSIPLVRNIEKQLQASVTRDKERLRILVGGNYRDLLTTAEEIITLDQRTRDAETQISDLSRQCKPPSRQSAGRRIAVISSTSAQLHLLVQCITCASTALQTRAVLVCAELTVISRLILKSLGEQASSPKSVENLRERAAALRRRLLLLIKSQLAHPASNLQTLVHAICAYCLVTSASSVDAVEHFRGVRLEKLRQRSNDNGKSQLHVKEDFQYLVSSVQILRSLLGRSVNDALSSLQKQPILQDQSIVKLEALDVDRRQNLIPQDILAFTPYIKRVLLKQEEVQDITSKWIKGGCEIFAKGLQGVLAASKSVAEIFALRKDLCSIILPVYFSIHAQGALLETVRQTTNARVFELCKVQTEKLVQIGHTIVSPKTKTAAEPSLWDSSVSQSSLAPNSTSYVRQIQSYHLGTHTDLSKLTKKIRSWARQVVQMRIEFQALGSTRWQDILEEADDEDEEVARAVVSKLSKDDPDQFRSAMEKSLQSAVFAFNQLMRDCATQATTEDEKEESDNDYVSRIVYLLRALRESSTILTNAVSGIKFETDDLASRLHKALANSVAKRIQSSLAGKAIATKSVLVLPEDLPSPQAFKLLQEICKVMMEVGGTDIWSVAAVSNLKDSLRAEIIGNESFSSQFHGEFDKHYIATALSNDHSVKSASDPADVQSKATAYWQRTKLLFGALG